MRPLTTYLITPVYQWAVDSGYTPYILVDTTVEGVDVPVNYIENNRIILNIAPRAVIDEQSIRYGASFNQIHFGVVVPLRALKAIYAKETGQGLVFSEQDMLVDEVAIPEPPKKPNLSLVK